jgi:hypothetical protein
MAVTKVHAEEYLVEREFGEGSDEAREVGRVFSRIYTEFVAADRREHLFQPTVAALRPQDLLEPAPRDPDRIEAIKRTGTENWMCRYYGVSTKVQVPA